MLVQNRVPWATQQMKNYGRSFALPITVSKDLFEKVSFVLNSYFQLQVCHFNS